MVACGTHGILIVDHDPIERGRLRRELEARGWHVRVAADAAAAVRLYSEESDDLHAAIVDLELPGLQGGRILAELEKMTPELTRFAMSANLTPFSAAAFRRISPTPLFAKPVRTGDLVAAIRNCRERAT